MMNDRFLFRAKRIDNGEWVQGYYTYYPCGFTSVDKVEHAIRDTVSEYCRKLYFVDPSTICQCTGLKDKNGNMVFENDIMSAHLDDCFPEDITYARVIWGDTGYCLREKGSIDIQPLEEIDMEHFTVCGNIFDNPELLEQEG
ncbi:YopX family protein [bacterium]|nr:YopX family protein [bacterium]MDY3022384.1 YopX family protein [Oliverpabstia sp.]